MIDKDYKYFEKNRDSFVKEHIGEFVLIKDEKAIGFYKNIGDAMEKANELGYKLGYFIVQECLEKDATIQRFHSRVQFV